MAVAAMSIIAAPQTNAKEAENRDAEGNIVFFLQEAIAAPTFEGVLLFPFTMDELLDEI